MISKSQLGLQRGRRGSRPSCVAISTTARAAELRRVSQLPSTAIDGPGQRQTGAYERLEFVEKHN
jgi:hypothetical protein